MVWRVMLRLREELGRVGMWSSFQGKIHLHRSAKRLFLGCVTRPPPHAHRIIAQPYLECKKFQFNAPTLLATFELVL